MIWYLLYPFRGQVTPRSLGRSASYEAILTVLRRTTEPPVLSPDHPIRSILRKHGASVARHWLTWILTCVALAVIFCYPSFFLYEDPTTGFSKLPYHVFTSAKRFGANTNARPDVDIRQIWIHGSYMKALNESVLKEALTIQETILGEKIGCLGPPQNSSKRSDGAIRTLKDHTWAFHSPLLLWNCSYDRIDQDEDLLSTVNNQSNHKSPFGFTLRPTSLFASKSFEKKNLQAADALVITLFDRVGSSSSQDWDARFAVLAERAPSRWSIYPHYPQMLHQELYRFQYKPMTFRDGFILFLAYAAMIGYVLVSVRKLRAFKSKFGLVVAVFVEWWVTGMTARKSLAGYKDLICGRFRLVNGLLAYPPQTPTLLRISGALGDVGHLSLASAGQNLLVLWILAKIVSPGVASFCAFAAVAIVVDFFFHLTFFLAVLTIDVQRMELQDSIERRNMTRSRSRGRKPGRRYWIDALLQGRLPISSRLAGSAISACFILALNMHFFDNESTLWALVESLKPILTSRGRNAEKGVHFSSPPSINQVRTPQAWLRIQDYNMAQEIIKFIKPDAHTIIARVYDPVNIVLAGSDRAAVSQGDTPLIQTALRLMEVHLYPLVLVVIFAVAFITLLMQYLLWNELPEDDIELTTSKTALTVKTLNQAHRLDVIQLNACSKGHIITIGLDQLTAIGLFDSADDSYSLNALKTRQMAPPFWPITQIAIDDNGVWAALLTENGKILCWNLPERRLSHYQEVDFEGLDPLLFSLVTMEQADGSETASVLVVLPNRRIIELRVKDVGNVRRFQIGQGRLVAAAVFRTSRNTKVIAAGQDGRVYVQVRKQKALHAKCKEERERLETCDKVCWEASHSQDTHQTCEDGEIKGDYTGDPRNARVKSIAIAQELGVAVIARQHRLDLFDMRSQHFVRFIDTSAITSGSVRVLHSPRRECPNCHGAAVHSISFAFNHAKEDVCVVRTFSIGLDYDALICLAPFIPNTPNDCRGIPDAKEVTHRVEKPGSWEATSAQAIIGIRRPSWLSQSQASTASGNDVIERRDGGQPRRRRASFLQRGRGYVRRATNPSNKDDNEGLPEWEVWTLTTAGDFNTVPLQGAGEQDDELFVPYPGPMKKLGKRSVAMAFGASVKVITLGNERFEEDFDEYVEPSQQSVAARRRKPVPRRT